LFSSSPASLSKTGACARVDRFSPYLSARK
jgi:hypothetical protein